MCVLMPVLLMCAGEKSRKRLGAFLTQSQFQARCVHVVLLSFCRAFDDQKTCLTALKARCK